MYGLLTEDKQRAIEVIVEKGAEKRRPELPDGNLPELEDPAGATSRVRKSRGS